MMNVSQVLRIVSVVCALCVVGGPQSAAAAATTCTGSTGICPSSGVCTIKSKKTIAPGVTIDCSGRDLVLKAPITVTGGTFTLIANDVTVNGFQRIEATQSATTEVGFTLQLTGRLTLDGKLLAKNAGGGTFIRVTAAGGASIGSGLAIDVSGNSQGVDGGEVTIDSGADVTIDGRVLADGKSGGTEANVNSGGIITIAAATDVVVNGEVSAFGRGFDGGSVMLEAGNDVVLAAGAQLNAYGQSVSGDGGEMELTAANRILLDGDVSLRGGLNYNGGESEGGSLLLDAGCGGVVINGTIDLTGGEADGGDVSIQSAGAVVLAGTIDADAVNLDGDGGGITVESGDQVVLLQTAQVSGRGDARNGNGSGSGGSIDIEGCQVDTDAVLAVGGAEGGRISVRGRKAGLAPVGAGDFGVRVSDQCTVDASGFTPVTDGSIELVVAELRAGSCSTNGAACFLDVPTCTVGWVGGQCLEANPDTDGRQTQFAPSPATTVYDPLLLACGACL